uniref:RNA-directed DNA polymerase from mobile element jockey-like n=1 Tax=Saccoglossus kowalevskii TaxID=10224 RepID=A0ABM0MYZ3_SACKO|nr:PREDICTED: RNA-directed DNA polymerase from mobile element jockey-like [Saccoglossus kowalevskii]
MAKILSMIINNRITKYLETNNIIHPNQAGFRSKHRTTDHIHVLTLHTVIKKYQTQKKRIYCCFVNLKKCFDTIWRTALQYKLLNNNINGKVYNIIKSMYTNMDFIVKLNDVTSPHFKLHNGVKQGCPLSPTLYNIYMNDFTNDLNELQMSAPELSGKKINCLQYADDIAILSTTSSGLQKALDFLHSYTTNWGLQNNTKKTQSHL